MTLQERISALITAIGTDVKALFMRSMPAGGSTGQVLTKTSNSDYSTSWQTPTGASQSDIQRIEAQNWFL
ncbi:hypothetical protein [Runella sp. SP2]|uniref:hypothetical protein n=1 Tax=Runella sp. SP2 TaxID=2268026 RepID=UPI000F085514|nr:hypothetical protein [Runella sp. SP2]AYQ31453.1 hypothetical protein DTQ70_04315 [Runella sp. SP2]